MTLHPWPQLALHPQHDCLDPHASHASTSPVLSFLWSFASMCPSIGRCMLTGRNHINIHMFSVNDCCRDKLFKSSSSCSFGTLSVSSRKSCANLIVILAIVTAAATRRAFILHTTWSTASGWLRHVSSSSSQAVVQAHCMFDNACSSSFLLAASTSVWNRFGDKAPFPPSHATRQRAKSMCFSLSVRTMKDVMLVI